MKPRVWMLAAIGGLALALVFALAGGDEPQVDESPLAEPKVVSKRSHRPTQIESPRPQASSTARQPRPEASRDVVRRRIHQALRRRYSDSRSQGERDVDDPDWDRDDDELPAGNLDREYIQETIREEVIPLVRECYDELLDQDAESEGRIVMQFDIVGDESVGGIVDDVTLAEESELKEENFSECVRESMASAVFAPPQGGGVVTVTYPMIFQPAPDSAG